MVRVWRNWNPHTLLLGMYNGAVTVENSLAVSEKVKHRIYHMIQQLYS